MSQSASIVSDPSTSVQSKPAILKILPDISPSTNRCSTHTQQQIDLLLLAIEALELGASEKMLATVKQLKLEEIVPSRVFLWHLRCSNPWRRSYTRELLSLDHEEREKFAAELGKRYPHLDIWVSGGSPQDYVKRIFATRGIKGDRLHLDYRASDTVTNFTTLVDELEAQGIDSVYLITSENHMTRARIIGEIVFGSRGIVLKPLAVPSSYPPEPIEKSVRDCARSILWLATGNSLAVTRKE